MGRMVYKLCGRRFGGRLPVHVFIPAVDFSPPLLLRWPCTYFPVNPQLISDIQQQQQRQQLSPPRRRLEITAPDLTQVAVIRSFGFCLQAVVTQTTSLFSSPAVFAQPVMGVLCPALATLLFFQPL